MAAFAGPMAAKQLRTSASQRTLNQHHLNRNRKFVDSPLEGDGFELPVREHRAMAPSDGFAAASHREAALRG